MISKNNIKLIKSLASKKIRQKEQLFLVEGDKMVLEVLSSHYKVEHLFATENFLGCNRELIKKSLVISEAGSDEINKASLLKSPQNSIALVRIPDSDVFPEQPASELILFLDGIQDPGNLGTIIRICDWFGIAELFCSPDTVDVYNPKVIQSSMGSFCRVSIRYSPAAQVTNMCREMGYLVYGAFLQGKNLYKENLERKALLVIGNEGNGIKMETAREVEIRISIPAYGSDRSGPESLNAAIATGIICAEFKRQKMF